MKRTGWRPPLIAWYVGRTTGRHNMDDEEAIRSAIEAWIAQLDDEAMPSAIVAVNFGLFETPDGYSAYLTGSSTFDPTDDSWAVNADYAPTAKYLALPRVPVGGSWQHVQIACKTAVMSYLARHPRSRLRGLTAVTVGFDDGDLERIL